MNFIFLQANPTRTKQQKCCFIRICFCYPLQRAERGADIYTDDFKISHPGYSVRSIDSHRSRRYILWQLALLSVSVRRNNSLPIGGGSNSGFLLCMRCNGHHRTGCYRCNANAFVRTGILSAKQTLIKILFSKETYDRCSNGSFVGGNSIT